MYLGKTPGGGALAPFRLGEGRRAPRPRPPQGLPRPRPARRPPARRARRGDSARGAAQVRRGARLSARPGVRAAIVSAPQPRAASGGGAASRPAPGRSRPADGPRRRGCTHLPAAGLRDAALARGLAAGGGGDAPGPGDHLWKWRGGGRLLGQFQPTSGSSFGARRLPASNRTAARSLGAGHSREWQLGRPACPARAGSASNAHTPAPSLHELCNPELRPYMGAGTGFGVFPSFSSCNRPSFNVGETWRESVREGSRGLG